MAFDAHKNFAYSSVVTAPVPANSGTSLIVAAGQGALFPAPPFNVTIWPTGVSPLSSNAEIARVTGIVGDTLTIVRAQEGSTARVIIIGDQIANTITAKILTDIEAFTLTPAQIIILGNTSGVNSGDQDLSPYLTIANAASTYSLLGHVHTFASLTSKPTTIAGYGITDFDSLGDARWSLLAHTHTFASLTSKPTTLSGYGITDAYPLVGNPSGFLTTFSETDPIFSASAAFGIAGSDITNWNAKQNPATTLAGYGITDAYPLSGNPSGFLTSVPAQSFASLTGKPTTIGGYGITDFNSLGDARWQPIGSYLTGNQTITLSGDVSGSGATAITTVIGAGKVTNAMLAGSIDLTTKVTGLLPDANISSATTWNAKQAALSGTGFVKITGTTISYDNSTYLTSLSGAALLATANTFTTNGALSAPSQLYTGTWITGGTATTNKPYFLIEVGGATSAAWSTNGTGLGVNAATGFTGNLIDLQLNGVNELKVSNTGQLTANSNVICGSASGFLIGSRTRFASPSDGVLLISNNGVTDFGRVQFGGTTSSFPSIKRNGTALNFRLADDSADAPITASDLTLSASNAVFTGTTNSNAASALIVKRLDGTNMLSLRNDGNVLMDINPTFTFTASAGIWTWDASSNRNFIINGPRGIANNDTGPFLLNGSFTSSSSTNSQYFLGIKPTINQTGTSTGIMRGLYIAPILTAAAAWLSIESANGQVKLTDIYAAGSGSLAGSLLDLNQTWNTSGTPTAIKLNVTNTASNAASLLMDLQVAAVSKFKVSNTGNVTLTNVLTLKGYTVATLPAGTQGDIAFVTDALTPTFLVAAVGGGAVVSPVFYNGTGWVTY